ncbi:hypothetical protein MPNT_10067 [Candidatus Methylacidithermus pantelleriae]|uniref:Uncharacterized protein n=1 Tax=Candidatus Methylacidithermus pantelleriae TaxID=2744239 RepID=A0A8J2BLF2_9BACT|nr:hypothetical protein MPNT_10067 [Candidatus Methylacidithermus pantelleriae]
MLCRCLIISRAERSFFQRGTLALPAGEWTGEPRGKTVLTEFVKLAKLHRQGRFRLFCLLGVRHLG